MLLLSSGTDYVLSNFDFVILHTLAKQNIQNRFCGGLKYFKDFMTEISMQPEECELTDTHVHQRDYLTNP